MRRPSAVTATDHTGPVWPVTGSPTGVPVARCHTRTVPSSLPLTILRPSGVTATARTTDSVAMMSWSEPSPAPSPVTWLIERPDRLVYMTSGLQNGAAPDLRDPQWTRRRWNWLQAYSDSKLFDTMLAFGVARRWPDVRSNAVSPGWVPTRMGGAGAPDDLDLGVETQAWLAAGDDPAAEMTGQYLFHRQRYDVPDSVQDTRAQEALFTYCAELTGQRLG